MKFKQTKKSVLGLTTVKAFIIVLLALAIIGIVSIVILGFFSTSTFVAQSGVITSAGIANETLTTVTETGENLAVANYNSVSCTINQVINGSNTIIGTGNRTVSNCNLASSGTGKLNNTNWLVTYSYTYRSDNGASGIGNNVSNGIVSFFSNASTYFSLLGVVVIILIISLVVVVVNRFGGESSEQGINSTM